VERNEEAPKKLFASLGGLRDMQVLIGGRRTFPPDDPVATALTDHARSREAGLKHDARAGSIVLTARHGVIGRGRYHGVSPFCIPATSSSSILH
jgi:hypothetical protein